MLAVSGSPFDSEEFFFEYKWDGFRIGAYIEGGMSRLMSRRGIDMTAKFPDLKTLRELPNGTLLDGEVVFFEDGKPLFEGLLGGGDLQKVGIVRFIAFDILYQNFTPVMDIPFSKRRRLLEEMTNASRCRGLILSEGVAAHGRSLYEKASELHMEGVMAKKVNSPYYAGKRSESWVKIKRRRITQAAIIGFIEKGKDDFKSILVAGNGLPGENGGKLHYMGKVGGGFSVVIKTRMIKLLRANQRTTPIVPCSEKARWVDPGLYCTISFTELTSQGLFRAPVFKGLIEEKG